jgi:hypothetical protein
MNTEEIRFDADARVARQSSESRLSFQASSSVSLELPMVLDPSAIRWSRLPVVVSWNHGWSHAEW